MEDEEMVGNEDNLPIDNQKVTGWFSTSPNTTVKKSQDPDEVNEQPFIDRNGHVVRQPGKLQLSLGDRQKSWRQERRHWADTGAEIQREKSYDEPSLIAHQAALAKEIIMHATCRYVTRQLLRKENGTQTEK